MGQKYHKHKGVESKGNLKSHPMNRIHRDKKVNKYHVMALKKECKLQEQFIVPTDKSYVALIEKLKM